MKDDIILCYFKTQMDLEAIAGLVSEFGSKFFVSAGTKPYMVLKIDRKKEENLLLSVKNLLQKYKKLLHSNVK